MELSNLEGSTQSRLHLSLGHFLDTLMSSSRPRRCHCSPTLVTTHVSRIALAVSSLLLLICIGVVNSASATRSSRSEAAISPNLGEFQTGVRGLLVNGQHQSLPTGGVSQRLLGSGAARPGVAEKPMFRRAQVHPMRSLVLMPRSQLGKAQFGAMKALTRLNAEADTGSNALAGTPRSPTQGLWGKTLDDMIAISKKERLGHLEEQAKQALVFAVENRENPVFPCALIAGDIVILELLGRLGYLSSGRVQVMFVDTFYLFEETIEFMRQTEERYGFKANWFHAEGFNTKAELEETHGVDFWKDDLKLYDRICKVEPYWRGLKTLKADAVINGRRRDHGFDRAFIEVYEKEQAGEVDKINPLAYWTFKDVWDFINAEDIAYHPLHDKGYPSIGDAKDTVPVAREKWFEYAGERLGRFNGLTNDDGSTKTECGIHLPHASDKEEPASSGSNKGDKNSKKGGGGGFSVEVM